MNGLKTMTWTAAGALLAASALAVTSGSGENPYALIAKRNVFGLQDPPAPAPPPEPDKPPPSEVKLTGITTLLGIRRALLKVQTPAKPPEPAKSESYILVEGAPAEGGIQVVKIDVENEKARIRKDGKEEWLPLEKDTSKPAVAAAVATGGGPKNPIAAALARAQQAKAAHQPGVRQPGSSAMPQRNVRTGQLGTRVGGVSGATANRTALALGQRSQSTTRVTHDYGLKPEEQVILIEANRLQSVEDVAAGNMPPLPPTPVTPPELDPTSQPEPGLDQLLQEMGQ